MTQPNVSTTNVATLGNSVPATIQQPSLCAPNTLLTPDGYAAAVIAEGQTARDTGAAYLQHPVMTPRGIQIALATVYVESNFVMYANESDSDSLNYPHQAVSTDANSDGLFQQRAPWWGTVAERMDPARSAAMFYNHLSSMNYNDPNSSPGSFAQRVQQSAFPGRYDQRFADSVALYDRLTAGITVPTPIDPNRPNFNEYARWCDNNQSRAGTKVDLWLIHTQEGDGDADSLASFLISTESGSNPVSYHYTISTGYPNDDGVTVCDVVDTDLASFSVMNSNDRSINLCFAGSYSSWTRDDWIKKAGRAIDVAAYLCVQDCAKYQIAMNVIAPPYNSNPPGIADHRYCGEHLKDGNNHSDVGDGFPWDVFGAAIQKYAATLQSSSSTPPPPATASDPDPGQKPAADPAPADPLAEILEQTRGRWAMLGNHTMVEAIAEIRDKVCGTSDAGKAGFSW
jgi:hypothetical protein